MFKQKSLILVVGLLSLMLVISGCDSAIDEDESEHTFKEITSDITEDTTLSSDETYTVTDDINVTAELTIKPGTVVKFEQGTGLNLSSTEGAIVADGTEDNKILFTGTDTQPGWWDGIWIKDSTNSNNKLDHVIVEYGGNDNVHRYSKPGNVIVGSDGADDSSSLDIINSILRESGSYGLHVFSDGEVNDDWETSNEFESNNDGKSNLN